MKELQSLLDYARAPDATNPALQSAAIDTNFFSCTLRTNGLAYFWTSTTDVGKPQFAYYVAFGKALAVNGDNTHGAGAIRSDPKIGDPAEWTNGLGPSPSDVVCISNYVRCVRGGYNVDSVGDGIPDWWRAQWFGGSGMTTNNQSCAVCNLDEDGMSNLEEYQADTDPTNAASRLTLVDISQETDGLRIWWIGGTSVTQLVEVCGDLTGEGTPWTSLATNAPPHPSPIHCFSSACRLRTFSIGSRHGVDHQSTMADNADTRRSWGKESRNRGRCLSLSLL